MQDYSIAFWGLINGKLEDMFKYFGDRICVDSNFSRYNYPFLIKYSQNLVRSVNNDKDVQYLQRNTSLIQSAELGIIGYQGTSKD